MIPEALFSGLLINKFTVAPKNQTFFLRNQFFKDKKTKKGFSISVKRNFHLVLPLAGEEVEVTLVGVGLGERNSGL